MTPRYNRLYSAASVAQLDRIAIDEFKIPGYTLMRRAGQAAFDCLLDCFPEANKILVVCGAGNNAGDGYVIARLAHAHGLDVSVVSMVDTTKLTGAARQACDHWLEVGEVKPAALMEPGAADVIVDALLGTGLARDVSAEWCATIESMNASMAPVLAVDIPSGLNADSGAIAGCAVRADATIAFIGLKKGLFTANGRECCGEIFFDDLAVPVDVYDSVQHDAVLLDETSCSWPVRSHASHKGVFGHALVVGGNHGMPGAAILAGRAALRSGAGKVSVITRSDHVNAVVAACPELMVHASASGDIDEHLLETVTHIAIGPGLGQDGWAQRLLMQVLRAAKPLVLDADALSLMASKQLDFPAHCIITPHPGEAARLLSLTATDIQRDRFAAVARLQKQSAAVVVLKGSGTLVADAQQCYVCPFGNPAMASAGMGDVLTGMTVALLAQGLALSDAATTAVCQHALAADRLVDAGQRVVLAGDVIDALR
jgi:NAD(P)H-hydrate epimerase